MEKLNISKGDSATIAIVLPADRMAQVNDIVVYIGNKAVGQKSKNTLLTTVDENIFLVKLSSAFTYNITGNLNVIVAVDYQDLGVKKVPIENALILAINENTNQFVNQSISEVVNATITLSISDDEIIQDVVIATIYRGFSAYELAVEKGFIGTEEEWVTATEAARVAAEGAKEIAVSASDLAVEKANEAVESLNDANDAKIAAQNAATTAANLTNISQINDIDDTAYVIEDGHGKVALRILKDGTVQGKFDISKIKLLFENMPDYVKSYMPELTDYNFQNAAYVIVDSEGKIALSIDRDGKVKGKFDLSQSQITFDNLSVDLQNATPKNEQNGSWSGYQYAVVDTEGKIAFAISNEGKVIASIVLSAKSVEKGMLSDALVAMLPSEDFLRMNSYNAADLVNSTDDELHRAKEVEVPQKTSNTGYLFNRMPYFDCAGLRGKNDTGVVIEIRRETGLIIRGKRNRGDYAPTLTSSSLITYKGIFYGSATSLPANPAIGDYYLIVLYAGDPQTQNLFGISMSNWAILYWNGTWLTSQFPFANAINTIEGDFLNVTAVGKWLDINVGIGDRLVLTAVKTNGGWNEPKLRIQQAAGEYYCVGECNPATFSPSVVRNFDLYVVSNDGTFDGISLKRGDYLYRNSGIWGVSRSELYTIENGKLFDINCRNANEVGIRRSDLNPYPVSFRPKTNISQIARKVSKDFVLYSDSMFQINVGAAVAAQYSDRVTSVQAFGSASSNNLLGMIRYNILNGDAYIGRTHVFWHGQNNNADAAQIKAASLEMSRLAGVSDARYVFWSILGQQFFTWNGTRLVDANHENAFNFVANDRFIDLENWYDSIFKNRHFSPRKAALIAAESSVKSIHFPGLSERQVADTYGIPPSSFFFDYSGKPFTSENVNFVGYQNAAGLPTVGNQLDYYIRNGNGTIGNIIVNVAGIWTEYTCDWTHVTPYGAVKLAEQFKNFININKF